VQKIVSVLGLRKKRTSAQSMLASEEKHREVAFYIGVALQ